MQASKTEAFWRRHVEAWRSSGLTQKQYGAKLGINALTLAHWSYLLKRKSSTPGQALVPVRVVGNTLPAPCSFSPACRWPSSSQYGTEAKCYRAVYRARWPQGFRCPECAGRPRSRFRRAGRVYYQCRACRHQTTLISGTLFEGTKLPLRTWFVALYLLSSTKTNLSALELKRHLGVRYRTAWPIYCRIGTAPPG